MARDGGKGSDPKATARRGAGAAVPKAGSPKGREVAPATRRRRAASSETATCAEIAGRPDHYKVICVSLYNEDLARLDAAVRELKRRGFTKANRSAVLRVAMLQLDLDRVPRGL